MADKVDHKRTIDAYRAPRDAFRVLDVPDLQYLMVDGRGDPDTAPAFGDAVASLYPLAYALKFASKQELGRDYVVMPLEGLWWADDMTVFTAARDKTRWEWTLMIMVPDWLGADDLARAVERVAARTAPGGAPRLADVRLETLSEGRCVQTLHVGPFDDEAEVLAALHDRFVPEQGLVETGTHHEIYLSDLRRVPPSRRRTILRQPVRSAP